MNILNLLIQLAPLAIEFVGGVVQQIQEGKLTKEEALAKLKALGDDSPERHARLEAVLNSPELADAYADFDSALGPDPE